MRILSQLLAAQIAPLKALVYRPLVVLRSFNKDVYRKEDTQPSRGHNRFAYRFERRDERKIDLDQYSPQAKDALISIIQDVQEVNPRLRVKLVNKGKMENWNLVEIIKTLTPDEGIQLLISDNVLIKKISRREMIQRYTENLAKQTEQQLLDQGSNIARKVVRLREKAERKKQSQKMITLNWNISLGDVKLQKKSEILKRINKGERFNIYIDNHKADTHVANEKLERFEGMEFTDIDTWNSLQGGIENQELEVFEAKRRQLILNELWGVLEDCTVEIKGKLLGFLILSCVSKIKPIETKQEVAKPKKKEKRLPKIKPKVDVDDLDALYSIKIEE